MLAQQMPEARQTVGRPLDRTGKFKDGQRRLQFGLAAQDDGGDGPLGGVGPVFGFDQASDGSERIQCMVKGSIGDEEDVGRTLATEILESGGREVIAEFRLS